MKANVKRLPRSTVELTIEASAEEVLSFRKQVIKDAAKHVDVKGFRKGAKIPEEVIVRQIGEETILKMTIEKAIDGIYRETLKKEKLIPVSQAEIKEVLSESPLKVQIAVEVFPTIEVKEGYRDVQLEREILEVSDSEVEKALQDIQTRFTHFHESEEGYESKMGDRVTIDTDGYEGDTKLESTSMRDYPLVLGSNILVPGFEEDIAGIKVGEMRDIDVTFPEDYHNDEFKGKKTKFQVTAKKIEHSHKPEFTPEFIKDLRGKELDLDGFKELIRSELLDTKESNDGMQRETKLIAELLKYMEFEVGEKLLAEQTRLVFNEVKENISKDNIKVSDYLVSLGLSEEEYKKQHIEPTALKRLQGELILQKLMEIEKVEVGDEDMKAEIKKIMAQYGSADVLKRLEELYVPGTKYYEELRRRLAFRRLIDSFFVEKKK